MKTTRKVTAKKAKLTSERKDTRENSLPQKNGSTFTGSYVYWVSNRWGAEIGKSAITSNSQSVSTVAVADSDLGAEGFRNQSAASQTGEAKYQETRLLSHSEINRRAREALRRAEAQRKELYRQADNVEDEP